jgi:hypothetical protein
MEDWDGTCDFCGTECVECVGCKETFCPVCAGRQAEDYCCEDCYEIHVVEKRKGEGK